MKYSKQTKHIETQEKHIKEYMEGLLAQDTTINGLRQAETRLDFTQFELQQSQGRIEDLEV